MANKQADKQIPRKPFYQRVSYRLLKKLFGHININLGQLQLAVPIQDSAGLSLLHWKPSWHTCIFKHALMKRPGAFIDAGVNVGQTLLDFLSLNLPQLPYYGFEPNSHAVSYVNKLIEHNHLNHLHIIPVGLSQNNRIEKLASLAASSLYATDARINFGNNNNCPLRYLYIPCFAFDGIRSSLDIPAISMVKIDVEGEELGVLQGMTHLLSNDRPLITCEVLHRDIDRYTSEAYLRTITTLRDLLHSHHYAIYYIAKQGNQFQLEPIDQFPDKIFVKPASFDECDYLFAPDSLAEWDLQQFAK